MNNPQQFNLEIADKEWEGTYSNFVIISHSNAEFVLDFARMLPGAQKAKVFSRIVMTPQHAKALLGTLETNIKKFEAQHGPIPAAQDPSKAPIGFQSDPPPAGDVKS